MLNLNLDLVSVLHIFDGCESEEELGILLESNKEIC